MEKRERRKEGHGKRMSQEEARKLFEETDLTELDLKPVEVEVKKPLDTVLSIRMSAGYMAKLSKLSKAQKRGITTMARMLLEDVLDRPGHQMLLGQDHAIIGTMNNAIMLNKEGSSQYIVFNGASFAAFKKGTEKVVLDLLDHLAESHGMLVKEGDPSFETLAQEV